MATSNAYRLGLGSKFTAVAVTAVLATGILISGAMLYEGHYRLRNQIIDNNQANITLAAEFARNYIRRVQESFEFLTKSPIINYAASSGDYGEVTSALREFIRVHVEANSVTYYDAEGVNRGSGIELKSFRERRGDRDWFKQVMATGKPFLGDAGVSPATGRPVVTYAVPVFGRQARVRGVILGEISLSTLSQAIVRLRPGSSARSSLVDRRKGGIILAHADPQQLLQPVSDKNEATDQLLRGAIGAIETQSAGEWTLVSFAPVPDLPWGIMIVQPSSAVFAPVLGAARDSLILMALLVLLTGLGAASLARHVTRPLGDLREAAKSFSAGDLAKRLNFTRQDELGDLGRTFDQMASSLAQRSMELENANQELQEQNRFVQQANRLKSEFLANMSHELRTPLNAIIGFAQLMHDGKVGAVSPAHQEYLGDILGSSKHLLELINDVLDLSKVEAGRMEFNPEPVILTKLIKEVRQILQTLSASKRLTIDIEVAPAVEELVIDPAKLKQVLYNYLSNAIKFTPDGGHITVRGVPAQSGTFRLEVEDNGEGIKPEDIDKLFVEFQQLEPTTTKKHQGTGLGLALTKKIVEAQGGSVGVQSRPGQGSIFSAILPSHSPEKKPSAIQGPLASLATEDGPSVLVIEDNETDRQWLAKILGDAGYVVQSAVTGTEGIAKAQAKHFAAIILDLILPDVGGWEVLHSVRAGGPNQQTPVIVGTVIAEKEVAKGFSVQDFLTKPIAPETLLEALKNVNVDSDGDKKKILVVDDDPNTLKMAQAVLQAGGYEAVCHTSAESGLQAAAESEFSAVVLDLVMPEVDGFEFLARFRELSACKKTPVVVWTSKDITVEDRQRLKNSAQSITPKDSIGIDAVLRDLQRHVGRGGEGTISHVPKTPIS